MVNSQHAEERGYDLIPVKLGDLDRHPEWIRRLASRFQHTYQEAQGTADRDYGPESDVLLASKPDYGLRVAVIPDARNADRCVAQVIADVYEPGTGMGFIFLPNFVRLPVFGNLSTKLNKLGVVLRASQRDTFDEMREEAEEVLDKHVQRAISRRNHARTGVFQTQQG